MVHNRTQYDIVNLDSFTKDVSVLFKNNDTSRTFIIDTPAQTGISVSTNNIQNLIIRVLSLSSNLPHRKCALGYKIKDGRITNLEIYPVTDAA